MSKTAYAKVKKGVLDQEPKEKLGARENEKEKEKEKKQKKEKEVVDDWDDDEDEDQVNKDEEIDYEDTEPDDEEDEELDQKGQNSADSEDEVPTATSSSPSTPSSSSTSTATPQDGMTTTTTTPKKDPKFVREFKTKKHLKTMLKELGDIDPGVKKLIKAHFKGLTDGEKEALSKQFSLRGKLGKDAKITPLMRRNRAAKLWDHVVQSKRPQIEPGEDIKGLKDLSKVNKYLSEKMNDPDYFNAFHRDLVNAKAEKAPANGLNNRGADVGSPKGVIKEYRMELNRFSGESMCHDAAMVMEKELADMFLGAPPGLINKAKHHVREFEAGENDHMFNTIGAEGDDQLIVDTTWRQFFYGTGQANKYNTLSKAEKKEFDETFYDNAAFPQVFVGTFKDVKALLYRVNDALKQNAPKMAYTDDVVEAMLGFWGTKAAEKKKGAKS